MQLIDTEFWNGLSHAKCRARELRTSVTSTEMGESVYSILDSYNHGSWLKTNVAYVFLFVMGVLRVDNNGGGHGFGGF